MFSGREFLSFPEAGEMEHLGAEEAQFLYRGLFEGREYLQHGVELAPGATVFDVGSNIGMFTRFCMAHTGDDVRVFAFEPIPAIARVARRNLVHRATAGAEDCADLGGCSALGQPLEERGGVVLYQAGLAAQPGDAEFGYLPRYTMLSGVEAEAANAERENFKQLILNNIDHTDADSHTLAGSLVRLAPGFMRGWLTDQVLDYHLQLERVPVSLLRLSDVVRHHGVERIDLLKVDVEKAEWDVLMGIDDEHWALVQQAVIEVHDIDGRLDKVQALLRDKGFRHVHVEASSPPRFLAYKLFGIHDPSFENQQAQELLANVYARR